MTDRIMLIAFTLFAVLAAAWAGSQFFDSGFSPERWQAARNAAPLENDRGRMLVDLIDRHVRTGMTHQELLSLLGPADQETPTELSYELGVATYGIDEEAYVFTFDDAGRLMEHHLVRR